VKISTKKVILFALKQSKNGSVTGKIIESETKRKSAVLFRYG
jgi:hypothetical protein